MGKVSQATRTSDKGKRGPQETFTPSKMLPKQTDLQSATSKTAFLLMLIIMVVSFAVYFNALFDGFVNDDIPFLVDNPLVKDFKFLLKIFTADLTSSTGVHLNFYRPLAQVINMCSFHLFGRKPWGFHLVNVLFHAGNSVLVFMIASLLLRETYAPTSGPPSTLPSALSSLPFIAALLFATHPIHTEAVTWISGLYDVSFAFFYLLSLWFYMRYKEGLKTGYLLSLASFFASTLCKEPALTLPLILIGHDYAFRKKGDRFPTSAMRYVPYVVIAGIYFALRYNALRAPATIEWDETYHGLSFYQYVINAFPLFAEYLRDMIFPFHLNFWHTFHPIGTLFNARGMLSTAVTVAYLVVVFLAWRRNKMLFFCLLFIIVPLLPAFYIKAITAKPYAERYLYLPLFGFVTLLAMSFDFLNKKMSRYSIAFMLIALSVLGMYCIQTIKRNPAWKDELTLYSDTVKNSPEAGRHHRMLGEVLMSMNRVDEANEEYQKTLPGDVIAHKYLADAYMNSGMTEQAKKQYQEIMEISPEMLVTYYYFSNQSKEGIGIQKATLIKDTIEQAVRLQPNNALYRDAFGRVYQLQNMIDKAIEQYQIAIKLKPDYAEPHRDLGSVYKVLNMTGKAIEQSQLAIKLDPDCAGAYYTLGVIYKDINMYDKAMRELQTFIKLRPNDADAHFILGVVYFRAGQIEDAKSEIMEGLTIAPGSRQGQQLMNKISVLH